MPPTPPEPLEENSTPATTYATLDPEDEQAAKKLVCGPVNFAVSVGPF